jgi:hypothetical protein
MKRHNLGLHPTAYISYRPNVLVMHETHAVYTTK